MSLWIVLLIAAVIIAILGFATVAKWLFILAVIVLVIGLVGLVTGKSRSRL
ncbi:MAG: hypothetical protein Q8L05_06415 [Actinomycetota bacterium]|nr:hypothetical protein [Actinomycetota bacterium]MDP2289422.1 hypothetical protein [Actinomycetota bacterium]